jgi:hypothetical protein
MDVAGSGAGTDGKNIFHAARVQMIFATMV